MAGIGFQLRRILTQDSLTASLKAYSYSALIATGPMLMTIVAVAVVKWVSLENLTVPHQEYFQNLVTYAYAFALVSTGLSYMVVTRYAADCYYRGDVKHFSGIFFSAFGAHVLFVAPVILAYVSGLSIPWSVKLQTLALILSILGAWLALIFLSAAKDYGAMLRAFAVGTAVSIAAAAVWGRARGLEGYLGGYTAGQMVVFLLLVDATIKEFGPPEAGEHYWLRYFLTYPKLALIGLSYNLGLWVDKIVFWASREGVSLDRWFSACPLYDVPLFLAYLSILPTMAYFLFQMETDFFLKYQAYYRAIDSRESLESLEARRRLIVESLGMHLRKILVIQAVASGIMLLIVPWVSRVVGLDPLQMGVFRIGIFASFFQAALLIAINLLLYFDFQGAAALATTLFCAMNAVFTWASLNFGLPAYGYGYAAACFLSCAAAFAVLNERLHRLHYWTFARQPLPPRPLPNL